MKGGEIMANAPILKIRKGIEVKAGIPFSNKQPRYNAETESVIRDAKNGVGLHSCKSLDQLFAELEG